MVATSPSVSQEEAVQAVVKPVCSPPWGLEFTGSVDIDAWTTAAAGVGYGLAQSFP